MRREESSVIFRLPYGQEERWMVETTINEEYRRVRFAFFSDRNERISRLSDISTYDPVYGQNNEKQEEGKDVWFPVVDIQIEPSMYAEAEIEGADSCLLNGYLNSEKTRIEDGRALFPAAILTDWENGLFLKRKARVSSFAIVKECVAIPSVSRRAVCEFFPLSDEWGGEVQVFYEDLHGHWKKGGHGKWDRRRDINFETEGTKNEEEALNLCLEFIIHSVNRSRVNPYGGGLYLFYDCDADCYRNGQWPWSWGTAISLLLNCAKLADAPKSRWRIKRSAQELRKTACSIGEVTLKFWIDNQGHPADRFGTVRYTPRLYAETGYEELINTGSDTGFLCGWGWIPLYEMTGDIRYLEAAEGYLSALESVLETFVIPPQEWLPQKQKWTDFTIDESGFGTEGIEAVYRITGEERYRQLCRKYIEKHLHIFERPDGLWNRKYDFGKNRVEETEYMTRGMGWAMEGLLAAYRCCPEEKAYLKKAIKMADAVIRFQREDGAWNFCFRKVENAGGTADKGTALWSYLLFRLYEVTGEKRYFVAARKALSWCMANQYQGKNVQARGGIVSISAESGVTYRPYFRMCCQYTAAFMGLAILEEGKVSGDEEKRE